MCYLFPTISGIEKIKRWYPIPIKETDTTKHKAPKELCIYILIHESFKGNRFDLNVKKIENGGFLLCKKMKS